MQVPSRLDIEVQDYGNEAHGTAEHALNAASTHSHEHTREYREPIESHTDEHDMGQHQHSDDADHVHHGQHHEHHAPSGDEFAGQMGHHEHSL